MRPSGCIRPIRREASCSSPTRSAASRCTTSAGCFSSTSTTASSRARGRAVRLSLGGTPVDLALASCLAPESAGVRVWRINPATRKLENVTAGAAIRVFDGQPPIGLCAYHSRTTGKAYFFVTLRSGPVEQYELTTTPEGTVTAHRVRAFALKGEVKSCIADDEVGVVYVAEDDVGIWRFSGRTGRRVRGKCVNPRRRERAVPNAKGPAIIRRGADAAICSSSVRARRARTPA